MYPPAPISATGFTHVKGYLAEQAEAIARVPRPARQPIKRALARGCYRVRGVRPLGVPGQRSATDFNDRRKDQKSDQSRSSPSLRMFSHSFGSAAESSPLRSVKRKNQGCANQRVQIGKKQQGYTHLDEVPKLVTTRLDDQRYHRRRYRGGIGCRGSDEDSYSEWIG